MKYFDALDLARRIKQERPDVIAWAMGYRDGGMVMVRATEHRDGYYPTKKGAPHFIESDDEWEALKVQLG